MTDHYSDEWQAEVEAFKRQEEIERQAADAIAKAADAWRQAWPDHCTSCGGWGGYETHQSHPYGMGSATETLFEACECTAERCPRCGQLNMLTDDEAEGPCGSCGWNYDDGLPGFDA